MHGMLVTEGQRRSIGAALHVFVLFNLVLWPDASLAASYGNVEVKPFGLLGTDASVSIRYLLDENDRQSETSPASFENRSTWEEEFFLISRSYVYHPAFLNMELGGGPLLVQQRFDSNSGSNSNSESLLNLLARLNFLELKSYPFSLYFQRSHPAVTTSLSGRFLTRNEVYGLSGRKTFVGRSANLTYEVSRRAQEGSGPDTVLDDEEDRSRFGFRRSYRVNDQIAVEYNRLDRNSASGSLGLPLQESRTKQERMNITAQNRFGGDGQFSLHQSLVRLNYQRISESLSEQKDLFYNASGRWQNSAKVRSTFDYRFNTSERAGADADSQSFRAGLIHTVNDSLGYGLEAGHEILEQTAFERKRSILGLNGNFSETAGFGQYTLVGSVRQARTDQDSTSNSVQVFDEPVTLNDTTPVDLANEFVVAATVVVTNAAGTQVFIEDEDYRQIVIGSVTSIQRLIDGNIFDGQTVLVDYQYQTSGTAKFDQLGASAAASLNFLRHFHTRIRYGLTDSNVISGELTTPLNDRKVFEFVVGGNVNVGYSWLFGAEFRHLDQDEEIAPFVQDSFSVNASGTVFGSMSVRFGASLTQGDQKESVEDIDQVAYRFGISSRLFGRARLGYDANYLEDTGGSLDRKTLKHRLTIQGRYRQVIFKLLASVSEEKLGAAERNYTQVTAVVTRYF
jgi:hypothetical protein